MLQCIAATLAAASSTSGCIDSTGFALASCFGYNPTDATTILQGALDSPTLKTLRIDGKRPWVTQPLFVRRSNVAVIIGAPLVARRGFFHGKSDTLLSFGRLGGMVPCDNATVTGEPGVASLTMWRADYDNASAYSHAEHRHGLQFIGCRSITVQDVTIAEVGGDGIYLSNVSNVSVRRSAIRGGYRNGISVISGDKLLFEDVDIHDVNGTSPRSGVDIEPNKPLDELSTVILRRVLVSDVGGCGIEVKHAWAHNTTAPVPVSVLLEDCAVSGAARAGLAIAPVAPGAQGTIVVRGTSVSNTACAGLLVDSKAVESARLELSNTSFVHTASGCTSALAQYGVAPISLGVNHVSGCGHKRWAEGETFGNVRLLDGVTIGSAGQPLAAGTHFINASQILPNTGPGGKVPPADPEIYRSIVGTVTVFASDKSACVAALGQTGARVQLTAQCQLPLA
jgi:hypothetical protein